MGVMYLADNGTVVLPGASRWYGMGSGGAIGPSAPFALADFRASDDLDINSAADYGLNLYRHGVPMTGGFDFTHAEGFFSNFMMVVGDFNNDGKPEIADYLQYPIVGFSPDPLAFPNTAIGSHSAPETVTMTNVGSAPLLMTSVTNMHPNFTENQNCYDIYVPGEGPWLAPGASCTIKATFRPTVEGLLTGGVTVFDNTPTGQSFIEFTGTGLGPLASLTSSASFGNQTVGIASAPQMVTLTNTGNAAMTITSVGTATVSNGTVSQSKTCGATLAAGASCTISLIWTPGTAGAMTGSIKVTDNAPGSPQVAALSGTGVLPAASLLPSSLSFPSQVVYTTSAAKTITLTNAGLGELVISKVAVTGPFTQTNACGKTVASGGTCTFSVEFTPTGYGTQTGTLTVTDNAPSSPQHVALTGIGQAIRLTPTSLTFGNQPKGSSSPGMSVTVANQGATAVTLKSISLTGADATDFSQTHTCGASLASGARCTVSVVFKPTTTGKLTATLAIADNGGGSPQTVALSGTGTP